MPTRTHTCGQLTESDIGATVTLAGWVNAYRGHGSGLTFVDLRDREGITQVVFDSEDAPGALIEAGNKLRNEDCIRVTGTVRARDKANPRIPTGSVEVVAAELEVLAKTEKLPFVPSDEANMPGEETRLKHRYLDLRRPKMQEILRTRHRLAKITRDYFDEQGFLEIETPMLCRSTPEGARDFLVPSRLQEGMWYALPQSPQLFKQILMMSGCDKYLQIVKCFRDEDPRFDRQAEFTQIDLEMSLRRRRRGDGSWASWRRWSPNASGKRCWASRSSSRSSRACRYRRRDGHATASTSPDTAVRHGRLVDVSATSPASDGLRLLHATRSTKDDGGVDPAGDGACPGKARRLLAQADRRRSRKFAKRASALGGMLWTKFVGGAFESAPDRQVLRRDVQGERSSSALGLERRRSVPWSSAPIHTAVVNRSRSDRTSAQKIARRARLDPGGRRANLTLDRPISRCWSMTSKQGRWPRAPPPVHGPLGPRDRAPAGRGPRRCRDGRVDRLRRLRHGLQRLRDRRGVDPHPPARHPVQGLRAPRAATRTKRGSSSPSSSTPSLTAPRPTAGSPSGSTAWSCTCAARRTSARSSPSPRP